MTSILRVRLLLRGTSKKLLSPGLETGFFALENNNVTASKLSYQLNACRYLLFSFSGRIKDNVIESFFGNFKSTIPYY